MRQPVQPRTRWWTRGALALATAGGLGLAPRAPGTVGTLGGVVLYWASGGWPWWQHLLLTVAVCGLSVLAAQVAGRHWGQADDQRIVIDEVAGYLCATLLLPFSWPLAGAAFALFRLFDILKPWPARWFDRQVHNGLGVTLDDVVAGLYACGLLHLGRGVVAGWW